MNVEVYLDPPTIAPTVHEDSCAAVTPAGFLAVTHLPRFEQTLYPPGQWRAFRVMQ